MNFNTCQPCATCTLRPGVPYVCCAKTAGYVGIVQSVILLIIAIVALEFISREYEEKYGQWIVLYPTNFTDINWGIFYVDYLVDGYGRSTVLFYIMALYLPISLLWLGASVLILCRIRYNYMPRPKRRLFILLIQ